MMKIANIVDDTVTNIIVAESIQWAVDNLGGEWIEAPRGVGPGWTRDGDAWVPPEPKKQRVTEITKLAFRNRFTLPEKEAIYTAAQTMVALKVFLDDLAATQSVDLTSEQTIASVRQLEAAGLIAAGRADEILAVE